VGASTPSTKTIGDLNTLDQTANFTANNQIEAKVSPLSGCLRICVRHVDVPKYASLYGDAFGLGLICAQYLVDDANNHQELGDVGLWNADTLSPMVCKQTTAVLNVTHN
jgi:hypothetical protein